MQRWLADLNLIVQIGAMLEQMLRVDVSLAFLCVAPAYQPATNTFRAIRRSALYALPGSDVTQPVQTPRVASEPQPITVRPSFM